MLHQVQNQGSNHQKGRTIRNIHIDEPMGKCHEQADMKTCTVNCCDMPLQYRGWCLKHYMRWWRHGDPQTTLVNKEPVTWEHLLSKSTINKETGCIEWTRATSSGYGVLRHKGAAVRTHRISYELNKGPIPDGLFVLHHCDNKLCITPDHLFLGTQKDNMRDMSAKGRGNHARGERAGRSKLTEAEVLRIRKTYTGKYGERLAMAEKYNVSGGSIWSVVTGRTWTHI